MSEKTLTSLIKLAFLLTVLSFASFTWKPIDNIEIIAFSKSSFSFGIVVTFLLIMSKLLSILSLSVFKGQKLSFVESMFSVYYIILTKEARQKWLDYIEEQRRKSVNS
jgi:hypothetical protein